ncbi:MAG: hypothetical protein AMXMBFR83_07430 [Phycisphaerae bacterium]
MTHRELAEYMVLRARLFDEDRRRPAEEVIHYAELSAGQPYKRGALMHDLSEGDCVTFTERCLALGCSPDWWAAYRLQNRLRYKDGRETVIFLNHDPLADWAVNNAWLLEDVTAALGEPLIAFPLYVDRAALLQHYRRTSGSPVREADAEVPGPEVSSAAFLPRESLTAVRRLLKSGDIVIIVGETAAPPVDPVVRLRGIHMGLIRIRRFGEIDQLRILHSYPPKAGEYSLESLLRNPSMRGCIFLRLREDARRIVARELERLQVMADKSPEDKDREIAKQKGLLWAVTCAREAEHTVLINHVEYGVVTIRPGETLWRLFRTGWKAVVDLEVNRAFKERHPNLVAGEYEGESVLFPLNQP